MAFLPNWIHPDHPYHVVTASPTIVNGTTVSATYATPTAWASEPTFIGDSNVPVHVASSAAVSAHSSEWNGTLGMLTVLLMLYNFCCALGLGTMLFKGWMDWKGNIKITTSSSIADDTYEGDDEANNTIEVPITDTNGWQWSVPMAYVERAVALADYHDDIDALMEITARDGATGEMLVSVMVDAAVETLRMQAAGLV